jgi:outer membrane protein assembly factor BamB
MLCCPNTRRLLAGGFSVAAILLAAVVTLLPRPSAVATADEPKAKAEQPAKADAPKVKAEEPVKAEPAKADTPKADSPKGGKSDLTCFGGDPSRNMVNLTDKGIPHALGEGEEAKLNEKLLKWKADLGSRAYGGPIIANGKIFVGTNNGKPRNPRDQKKAGDDIEPFDKGVLMCFDEKTGEFLWQAVNDKLPSGQVNDWPLEGVCAAPLIDGNRVYLTTNRCTIQCLDINGGKDGFQGKPLKFKDAATMKDRVHDAATDADVIWELDMMKDLGVFPHNMTAASPMLVGDILFCVTANGVDENHVNIPAPNAPSFVAVDKTTGKVLWQRSDPGKNIMHGQWANPAYAEVDKTKMVIFPGGDGWVYAFTPEKGELLWKFDANPKDTTYELGGAGTKSDFIGTPVVHDGLCYIGTGQDPEHFTGIAHFYAIDLKKAVANAAKNKAKDVSPELVDKVSKNEEGKEVFTGKPNPESAVAWHYGGKDDRKFMFRDYKFGRTMSTACLVDGVCYISELNGILHALDAKTGKKFWSYDTKSQIWGSAYYVDGKVYLGCENGELFVFKHVPAKDFAAGTVKAIDDLDNPTATDQKSFTNQYKQKRKTTETEFLLGKADCGAPIRSTPVVANGVLYVMTENTLFAIGKK